MAGGWPHPATAPGGRVQKKVEWTSCGMAMDGPDLGLRRTVICGVSLYPGHCGIMCIIMVYLSSCGYFKKISFTMVYLLGQFRHCPYGYM